MTQKNHFSLSDAEFKRQFQNGSLDPILFGHEAHLRLAWIHIHHYGLEIAIDTVCTQLFTYVVQLGNKDKYNKTLTIAAIKAVHHFMQKSVSAHFMAFMQEFPRLKYHFKDLMDCHYGFDIFNSKEAKSTFLGPDKLPFD